MAMEYLQNETLGLLISCLDRFIKDDIVTPGWEGKSVFLETVLSRGDFFPSDVMQEINRCKGNMPVADYLFSHTAFELAFNAYRR